MAKKKKKMDPDFSDKDILENLGENTKMTLRKQKARITRRPGARGRAYTKKEPKYMMYFKDGCDLLEYSIVVKPFIYRRYNIKNYLELDVLLYLYPKQFFTIKDFNMLGLKQHNIYVKTMVELGYLEVCVKAVTGISSDVYTLTDHAIRIVEDYYKYLSGEKTIALNNYSNPFKGPERKKVDELRERVMLKLKKQAENNTRNFKGKLY